MRANPRGWRSTRPDALATMAVGETKRLRWPALYTYRKREARAFLNEPDADWSMTRRGKRGPLGASIYVTRTR